MAKRVSLQGKGVELFFGGAPHATADPEAALPTEAATTSSANLHARVHARIGAGEDDLLRGLGEKQRLASSTFRFQPEELELLDALFDELNHAKPRRISKNDLVRLGLRWLLSDYETNAQHSLVGKLLERV